MVIASHNSPFKVQLLHPVKVPDADTRPLLVFLPGRWEGAMNYRMQPPWPAYCLHVCMLPHCSVACIAAAGCWRLGHDCCLCVCIDHDCVHAHAPLCFDAQALMAPARR